MSARHVVFDEAHFSSGNRPPNAQQLIDMAEEHLVSHSVAPTISLSTPSPHTPILHVHLIPNLDDTLNNTPAYMVTPHTHVVPTRTTHRVHIVPHGQPPSTTTQNLTLLVEYVSHPHVIPPDNEYIILTICATTSSKPVEFFIYKSIWCIYHYLHPCDRRSRHSWPRPIPPSRHRYDPVASVSAVNPHRLTT